MRHVPHEPRVSLADGTLPLVLVGLPGAGKTTVARLLACALGVQVTDTDAEVRRRARLTVPQIFEREGEEGFRDRETRALRAVLAPGAGAHGVIALGGGAVLREANRALLAGRTVIQLVASPQTAAAHVGDGTGRPLIRPDEVQGADSDATQVLRAQRSQGTSQAVLARMEALHAQRTPLYDEVATLRVPTDALSPEQVAALVLVSLGVQPAETAHSLAAAGADHLRSGRSGAGLSGTVASGPSPDQAEAAASTGPETLSDGAQPYRHEDCSGAVDRDLIQPLAWSQALTPEAPQRVTVSGPRPYEVLIGTGLTDHLAPAVLAAPGGGAGGVGIVHAEVMASVAARYAEVLRASGLRVALLEVPDGEPAKRTQVLDSLWQRMGELRLGRDGMVIGLGGGATTDLAGFAAATWLRGVPLIQVPTTLLAMVDAAVGGKTGINTPTGKNLVGAFHPPAGVLCDLEHLSTLSQEELRAGLGEVVKCGLIADPVILDRVLADPCTLLTWDSPVLAELITRSVDVKASVVSQDLIEAGLREVLNYGHTYAHGIETLTSHAWRHGEAVAVGCVFAAEVAHRLSGTDPALLALHRQAFAAVGLPTSFPQGEGRFEALYEVMLSDKKVRGGAVRMVLLDDVARPRTGAVPQREVLLAAHEAVTGGSGGGA